MSIKIYKETSTIGEKVNKIEKLLQELAIEIAIGPNQELHIIDHKIDFFSS